TSGSSGSVSLTTDGLTAGTSYNVDLLGDSTSTYTVLAHVSLSVSSQPRAVSLDKTAYTQGNTITAAYSTTQSSSTNWIGIYPDSGVKPGSTQALVWAYAPNGS